MVQRRQVHACRWARQTLTLPYPAWLEADERPWACMRPGGKGILESTDICETCPNWQPRRLETSVAPADPESR